MDQTFVQPLEIEKIRWFYKDRKQWVTFKGHDSLQLERKYRQLKEFDILKPNTLKTLDDTVVVRGNMYVVNIYQRKMFPIYWNLTNDDNFIIELMRGTWFHNGTNLPLESEALSDVIESHHQVFFGSEKLITKKKELNTRKKFAKQITRQFKFKEYSITVDDYQVRWTGMQEVFINKPSLKTYLLDKVGLGWVGNGIYRGYHEVALDSDRYSEITHLCLVIQGIDQTFENNDIVEKVLDLGHLCENIKKSYFNDFDENCQRIEFIPVELHKLLTLDRHTINLVTPPSYNSLRTVVNASVLNILFYTDPVNRLDIIESLKSELNRLYTIFCQHNPQFRINIGKVSVIAHSLGSVLIYDVLSDASTIDNRGELLKSFMESEDSELKILTMKSKPQKELKERRENDDRIANKLNLLFKVENVFNLGSPLPIFLAMRGIKPHSKGIQEDVIDSSCCNRFFNIFHPSDPMVYRMEPLINEYYRNIQPVKITRLEKISNSSYLTPPDRLFNQLSIGDYNKHLTKRSKGGYLLSDRNAEYDYSDDETIAENVKNALSNIGLETKDKYDYNQSSATLLKKTATNVYYKKRANVIESRNDMNITYSIDTFSENRISFPSLLSYPKSKERQTHSTADSDYLKSISNMNINNPSMAHKVSSDVEKDVIWETDTCKTLKWRIDYKLPADRSERVYLSSITSQDCYWTNEDLCMFILTQLLEDHSEFNDPV